MINQLQPPLPGDMTAVMATTAGEIKIRLFPQAAPKAVENFVTHAENGYYDGVVFHRVIDGFMIQGGDPTATGRGGESIWGKPFEDEFSPQLHNLRGALSMANAGRNTNGSQFFIVQADRVGRDICAQMEEIGETHFPKECIEQYKAGGGTPWLDFKHTVFGQVYEGLDIVDAIAAAEVDANDKPLEDIAITGIRIETAG